MTRRERKRDFRGGPLFEFFNTIDVDRTFVSDPANRSIRPHRANHRCYVWGRMRSSLRQTRVRQNPQEKCVLIVKSSALSTFDLASACLGAVRRRAGGSQADGSSLPRARCGRRLGLNRQQSGGCRLNTATLAIQGALAASSAGTATDRKNT
jgi:hypothetical protein